MFEFLFKYPASLFSKGNLVLLGSWPAWLLFLLAGLAAAGLFWHMRRNRARLGGLRPLVIWGLQTALIVLLLLMLWRPALSVATLRPQQNIVAVVMDNSRSMGIAEDGTARIEQASRVLSGGLLDGLSKKFQVRLYRFGADAERVQKAAEFKADLQSSHIGESLRQVLAESSTLPLGAVVLLSDGADNSGGIDRNTIAQLRQQRIPVHTLGIGRERMERDLEIADVAVPTRALADSRLHAEVTLSHSGLKGQKARLTVKDGGKALAAQEVTLKGEGRQTETVLFNAGAAGPRNLQIAIEPLAVEENRENNTVSRLVHVESGRPRVLYIEGEPRWEYKFIRRAVEDDTALSLVTVLRTTQNKLYRQGVAEATELEAGFPAKAEDLFAYQGLIIGNVELGYFTPAQQELIAEFANRRGGGVLFLGGRAALSDGGYGSSPLAGIMPVELPDRKATFHRDHVPVDLASTGRDSIITRLEERPDRNAERWKKMPALADYQEVGAVKPGALALLEIAAGSRRSPLLAVQNYGRGRVAVFATGGSWRWQMQQDLADQTHEMFWRQLLRYLVSGTPGPVISTTPRQVLADERRVPIRAEVRDKAFQHVSDARVEARIVGPEGLSGTVQLEPSALEPGVFTAEWTADRPGSYLAEVVAIRGEEEVGRDVLMFRREDGVAEHFRAVQNRELLEKLASETGGRYYVPSNASRLIEEISYSEAGITARETRDLWNMPIFLFAAILIRASEWVLRRRWGVV
jgi:uncharacterized membrane protein